MLTIAKRGKRKASSRSQVTLALNRLEEAHNARSEKLLSEVQAMRLDIDEVKGLLTRFKPARSRRGLLFSRRSIPVEVEAAPSGKTTMKLEELLPLLPQLGSVVPQLNHPKMAETLKILSNPAVIRMLQQFLANGGLGKAATPARGRHRY